MYTACIELTIWHTTIVVRSLWRAFTFPYLFSLTAFAIRICSLLTNILTFFQLMDFHFICLPVGAPAGNITAVICFPTWKDFPNYLAKKHLPGHDCNISAGRQLAFGSDNIDDVVCHQSVYTSLQSAIRFFLHLTPASPSVCLAVLPAWQLQAKIRRFHVPRYCRLWMT